MEYFKDEFNLEEPEKEDEDFSRIPFYWLNIKTQNRHPTITKKKEVEKENYIEPKYKENHGIDVETYDGYAHLITDDTGRNLLIEKHDKESFDKCLEFLTYQKYHKTFNWFYNIRFDFESIIKHLYKIDKDLFYELNNNKQISYKRYTLSFYSKMKFTIKDHNNHRNFNFYDISNFVLGSGGVKMSLDNASKKFLGEQKIEGLNKSLINESLDYWEEHKEEIIRYCIKDSLLTKKLGDNFWGVFDKGLDFKPKYPFSAGHISQEYLLKNVFCPTINHLIDDRKALEYAYNGYYAGRFELIKKGYFPKVYNYDIKSAYPSQMIKLIDYSKGKWIKMKKINWQKYEPDLEAHTAFYTISVNCMEDIYTPIRVRKHESNFYMNGEHTLIICKEEYEFIQKYFPEVKMSIIKGIEFFINENDLFYPFKNIITKLYAMKESDKEEDKKVRPCIKIILNSMYGKTIQRIKSDEYKFNSTTKEKYYVYNTGELFNPIYANLICAWTRIQLLTMAHDNPKSIIEFATDGIYSEKPLKNFKKEPLLGEWGNEFIGEGIFLQSGINTLWKENEDAKVHSRGFALKDKFGNRLDLRHVLESMTGNKTTISWNTHRPKHISECIRQNTIEKVNIFSDHEHTLDINTISNRVWLRNFKNGKECLDSSINSIPYY